MNDFEELKQKLIETCKFTCYTDPDNCDCFGIESEEIRKETGNSMKESIEDAFYSIEDCPFFQSMSSPTHYLLTAPRDDKGRAYPCYDLAPLKQLTNKTKQIGENK